MNDKKHLSPKENEVANANDEIVAINGNDVGTMGVARATRYFQSTQNNLSGHYDTSEEVGTDEVVRTIAPEVDIRTELARFADSKYAEEKVLEVGVATGTYYIWSNVEDHFAIDVEYSILTADGMGERFIGRGLEHTESLTSPNKPTVISMKIPVSEYLAPGEQLIHRINVRTSSLNQEIYLAFGGTDRPSGFIVPIVANHNYLDGLQGGADGEYYHLTMDQHDKNLLADGDGSNLSNAFVEASNRENLTSGEKLSESLGKQMKWFTDLKPVAWSGNASDLMEDESNRLVTDSEKDSWNGKLDQTGGEVTGDLTIPHKTKIKGTNTGNANTSYLEFMESNNTTRRGYIGDSGADATFTVGSDIGNVDLKAGSGYKSTVNGNEIWHEGNDGSDSGLDADLLDGLHASSFLKSSTRIPAGADLNTYMTEGMYYSPLNADDCINVPIPRVAFSLLVEKHAGYKQTWTQYIPTEPVAIYVRNFYSSTGWGEWYQLMTESGGTMTGQLTVPSALKIKGSGSGDANISRIDFYESDGTIRRGTIGDTSSSSNMNILSDIGDVVLSVPSTKNAVVQKDGANHIIWHEGNMSPSLLNERMIGYDDAIHPTTPLQDILLDLFKKSQAVVGSDKPFNLSFLINDAGIGKNLNVACKNLVLDKYGYDIGTGSNSYVTFKMEVTTENGRSHENYFKSNKISIWSNLFYFEWEFDYDNWTNVIVRDKQGIVHAPIQYSLETYLYVGQDHQFNVYNTDYIDSIILTFCDYDSTNNMNVAGDFIQSVTKRCGVNLFNNGNRDFLFEGNHHILLSGASMTEPTASNIMPIAWSFDELSKTQMQLRGQRYRSETSDSVVCCGIFILYGSSPTGAQPVLLRSEMLE